MFETEIYQDHKFPYKWNLADAIFTKDKGKVFSCFACGGGSTMGYKLAGFDVLGCNEIDKKMMELYKLNHNPKYAFNEDIRIFKQRNDLPDELYSLDILDGSPPCSSFSMAGNREKDWGKEKIFNEGQAKQVLDTLFFDFIDLGKKLQPKIIIAENVSGILKGNAYKTYYVKIHDALRKAGYKINAFLLNAKNMGVPQSRERVFIIGIRNDLCTDLIPKIDMRFNEIEIVLANCLNQLDDEYFKSETDLYKEYYEKTSKGNVVGKFNAGCRRLNENKISNTITASGAYTHFHPNIFRQLSKKELCNIGTFPTDYDFGKLPWNYIIGMSVPPVMMAQIASRIYESFLADIVLK